MSRIPSLAFLLLFLSPFFNLENASISTLLCAAYRVLSDDGRRGSSSARSSLIIVFPTAPRFLFGRAPSFCRFILWPFSFWPGGLAGRAGSAPAGRSDGDARVLRPCEVDMQSRGPARPLSVRLRTRIEGKERRDRAASHLDRKAPFARGARRPGELVPSSLADRGRRGRGDPANLSWTIYCELIAAINQDPFVNPWLQRTQRAAFGSVEIGASALAEGEGPSRCGYGSSVW